MAPEFQGIPDGFIPAPPGSTRPTKDTVAPESGAVRTSGAIADAAASSDTVTEDGSVKKYALIIIGLLSGNLLVVLLLLIICVGLYIKRNGRSGRSSEYAPVKVEFAEVKPREYGEAQRYSD
jgi:hypothetical protein